MLLLKRSGCQEDLIRYGNFYYKFQQDMEIESDLPKASKRLQYTI